MYTKNSDLDMAYSNVPNKSACTFISGKAYLVGSIEVRAQNLLEINVHARLFGTLEYLLKNQYTQRKLLNFENSIKGGLRSFQKSEF